MCRWCSEESRSFWNIAMNLVFPTETRPQLSHKDNQYFQWIHVWQPQIGFAFTFRNSPKYVHQDFHKIFPWGKCPQVVRYSSWEIANSIEGNEKFDMESQGFGMGFLEGDKHERNCRKSPYGLCWKITFLHTRVAYSSVKRLKTVWHLKSPLSPRDWEICENFRRRFSFFGAVTSLQCCFWNSTVDLGGVGR